MSKQLTTLPGTKYVCPFCHGKGKLVAFGESHECTVCQKGKQQIYRAVFTEYDGATSSMLVVGEKGKREVLLRFSATPGVKVTFEPYKEAQ